MNDFFNLLGDFFQNRPLTNEEQILLGILALIIFAIGIIIGWIVQGSKTRRYKKELLLLRKDRDEFEARYRAGETKQKTLAKELETVSREKVEALDRIQGFQNDLSQRDTRIVELTRSNDELNGTNQSYAATIESLNDQVLGLKTENEQLVADAERAVNTRNDTHSGGDAGAKEVEGRNDNLNAYIATSEARFQALEARITNLSAENAELRNTPTSGSPYTGHRPVMNPGLGTPAVASTGEPLVIRADTTEAGARTGDRGNTEVIVQTTPSIQVPPINGQADTMVDDLTLIDNVGTFLQQKLNEADIFRYKQIAGWTEADIMTYTELIGYLPGIIQRDDWVGQAKMLALSEAAHASEPTPTEAETVTMPGAAEETPAVYDNLRIVEGIGPKIESILRAGGITSLAILADTSIERLREILAEAGSRFKSHDPKTWPVQAGLAADGKLEELKAWQGELKGGR